ncbi:MAG: alpha/beta fold hydrolase [Dehalococcoidia bacterium]
MPYADSQGIRIHYHVEGAGPPLVLQHGITSSIERWRDCGYVDALRSDYRLILIDARGHGTSDKPHDPPAYDMKLMAGDVIAVLDDLNVDKAHYWGYSMGGIIAFRLAEYAPRRFPSLIIGGMHPYALHPEPYRELFKKGNEAVISAWEAEGLPMTQETRARLLANDAQALYAIVANDLPDRSHVLPTMSMPCLVYCGDADELYPGAQECAKHMPTSATFVSLPGLNHMEALVRSDLVLPHATEFLSRIK